MWVNQSVTYVGKPDPPLCLRVLVVKFLCEIVEINMMA